MREFLVVNQSTLVSDKECKAMAAAVSEQVRHHFAPAWGLAPVPVRFGDVRKTEPGSYIVYVLDASDEDGALGYHTEEGDKEFAKIFAKPVLDSGGVVLRDAANSQTPTVASVLSHEVLELMADVYCNTWVEGPKRAQGNFYALEVCDPVEAQQHVVKGVAVSNFVLPEWFNEDTTADTNYDYMGILTAPFTLAKGGYMVVRGPNNNGAEVFAKGRAKWRTKAKSLHGKSRTNRRKGL